MSHQDDIITDPTGAANQSGLRDQNARIVLSLIRRNGAMPSAEIARKSGLSAQTVSNITRALEADGLVQRGKATATKGKVGKPSVPVMLNPDGVHALGLSLGRRSAELVLVDFLGQQLETVSTAYAYPIIEDVFQFLQDGIAKIFSRHPSAQATTTGIGIAQPSQIWNWLEVVQAPEEAMRKWRDLDLRSAVSEQSGLDVFIQNDATSACVAEHLLRRGAEFANFAYIFLGAFIGGGLVLNGKVVSGRTGNAASLGPMPVSDTKGGTTELLNVAGLHVLETKLRNDGIDPMQLRRSPEDWSFCLSQLEDWISTTSAHLAIAAASITSVVEVDAVLIDGAIPKDARARLTHKTQQAFKALDLTLIERPKIGSGLVGRNARSVGAALLPIHSRYFPA